MSIVNKTRHNHAAPFQSYHHLKIVFPEYVVFSIAIYSFCRFCDAARGTGERISTLLDEPLMKEYKV